MLQRVLHIIGRMDRAGAETMVMNLYREIDRTKFQFDFVYFTEARCDYDDEIEALGGRIYRIAASNPVLRFFALHKILREGNWQIVHSHTLLSSALHLFAARLTNVPRRVAHSHNTQDDNSATLTGWLYQSAARWLLNRVSTSRVACGTEAAAYLFPGHARVVTIPNAVDIDRFANARGDVVRSALGIDADQVVLVQVARFMPVKNHVRTVAIARALQKAGVKFQLLLVGTGPEKELIENLVHEQGLKEYVRLLGLRTDIPELMAASDVMLMPSLYEGFPVVLVEAQAAGLPSVISKTITKEVDQGLGLVHFSDLDATDESWVKNILTAAKSYVPNAAKRRRTLEAAGFSSSAGAARLEKVYSTA